MYWLEIAEFRQLITVCFLDFRSAFDSTDGRSGAYFGATGRPKSKSGCKDRVNWQQTRIAPTAKSPQFSPESGIRHGCSFVPIYALDWITCSDLDFWVTNFKFLTMSYYKMFPNCYHFQAQSEVTPKPFYLSMVRPEMKLKFIWTTQGVHLQPAKHSCLAAK